MSHAQTILESVRSAQATRSSRTNMRRIGIGEAKNPALKRAYTMLYKHINSLQSDTDKYVRAVDSFIDKYEDLFQGQPEWNYISDALETVGIVIDHRLGDAQDAMVRLRTLMHNHDI